MQDKHASSPPADEVDKPPLLQSWTQLYVVVLVFHAFIIFLFYLFTHAYS